MKRLAIFGSILVVALLVPQPAALSNNAAVVIHPPSAMCGFFDGDGELVVSDDAMIVATQSANGNKKLRCRARGLPNSTGKAVRWNAQNNPLFPDLPCNIMTPLGDQLTTKWHQTVSASGNATLVCFAP